MSVEERKKEGKWLLEEKEKSNLRKKCNFLFEYK